MADNTGRSRKYRRLHNFLASLIALAVLGVAQFALERADDTWLLLVAAVVIAAVTLWSLDYRDYIATVLDRILQLPGEMSKRARVAVAAGMGLVLAGAAGVAFLETSRDDTCPQAIELRILASPEGLQLTREVARAYTRATARDHGGCPAVYPYVYAAGTAAVSGALARKWADAEQERPLEQLGPRPDVWLPDSMLDVRQVQDIAVKGTLPSPLERVTSIGSSPIVLAGTEVDAEDAGADSLPQLVSALLDRRAPAPSLSAADPRSSTAGLLAADVYLRDAGGEMVEPDVARRRARVVFDSTGSATDEVSVLCAYLREGKAPAAVLTSLRTWQRFVEGKTLGGAGCAAAMPPPAGLPEPAVFKSAPALDHPLVQFTWTSTRHRRAVEQFRDWLLSEDADPHLREAGLDEPDPACSDPDRNACLPHEPRRTLTTYEQAKRPGRVLLAVDASGSMGETTGSARTTRFMIAAQGVAEALGQLGTSDEFGLWSFPIPRGRSTYELVRIAAGSPQHRRTVVDTLRSVEPAGTTPLHATILAGMRELAADADGRRIQALVVLTDGENTSGPGLRQTLTQVRRLAGAQVRLYVIATGAARCEPLYQLTRAGRGGCLAADSAELPETMAGLFETLWSGR